MYTVIRMLDSGTGGGDPLTPVLAAWGAAVSTLLAILQVIEFRHKLLRQLVVTASAHHARQDLSIVLENTGQRPVTITSVDIRYGREPGFSAEVFRITEQLPKKLTEGDVVSWNIPRSQILESARRLQVQQTEGSRLWAAVHIAGRRIRHRFVDVDLAFVPDPSYKPINDYVAADMFLEFPPRQYKSRGGKLMK